MNYEKMSDYEINELVLAIVSELDVTGGDPYYGDKNLSWDYCNNPSDAWPIIADMIANGCVVQIMQAGVIVTLQGGGRIQFMDKNPIRAAMTVFLMMQEQKS